MIKQAIIVAGLVCLVLLLAACASSVQTTSESDTLGGYAAKAAVAKGQAIDPVARQSALSEPALRFPARIGLARLENGVVSPLPQDEAEAWLVMVKDLGPGWGEFVPLSPLELAPAGVCCHPPYIATTMSGIRRSAARQHLDAVLIYEVVADRGRAAAPYTVASWAPLDSLLALTATGQPAAHAQGVLIDARNGAVYGFASGGADHAQIAASDRVKDAVAGLAKETAVMLRDLRIELAEARASRAEAED